MRMYPESTITLYSGISITDEEQLAFSSLNYQEIYFRAHAVRTVTDCTYIPKTGEFKVPINMYELSQCNYLSFTNPYITNSNTSDRKPKTIYARIVDCDYVNNETTSVVYAIDFWQTWMFDVTFEDCYIEREHLSESLWTLAQTNPYDPSIMEFRTAEDLPISKDLEKPFYNICEDATDEDYINNYDGYKIGDLLIDTDSLPVGENSYGILLKLSSIDFEDRDQDFLIGDWAGGNAPSREFIKYLTDYYGPTKTGTGEAIASQGLGYYTIPADMYRWLSHGANPLGANNVPGATYTGSDWKIGGVSVQPWDATYYQNNCMMIYDMYGGDMSNSQNMITNILGWLTENDCLSSIVDIRLIPNKFIVAAGVGQSLTPTAAHQKTAKTFMSNIVNKKLALYPYSYLRVLTPVGDVKELRYEDYKLVQEGYDDCAIAMLLDINDVPSLNIMPDGYRMGGMSKRLDNGRDCNMYEAIYHTQFPTAPYTVDAYLAQLANASVEAIQNRTVDTEYNLEQRELNVGANARLLAELGSLKEMINNLSNTVSSFGTGIVNSFKGFVGGMFNEVGRQASRNITMGNLDIENKRLDFNRNKMETASKTFAGNFGESNMVAKNLERTRPAYACNKYVSSNGVGVNNMNVLGTDDVVFMRVALNPEILSKYDKYFTLFGYSSGRCGIARVVEFTRGSNDNDVLPHWQLLNDKYITYIKTVNCHVICNTLDVAQYIEAMFDSGIRMIKGDSLH